MPAPILRATNVAGDSAAAGAQGRSARRAFEERFDAPRAYAEWGRVLDAAAAR